MRVERRKKGSEIMSKKKTAAAILVLFFAIFSSLSFWALWASEALPERISVSGDADIYFDSMPYISVSSDYKTTSETAENDEYKAQAKIMGIIPVKNIDVSVVEEKRLIICGTPFGIRIKTKGIVVIGTEEIKSENESVCPAEKAGIRVGDIIENVNGVEVSNTDELVKIINESSGDALTLTILRGEERFSISLTPVYSPDNGVYKAGLWVKDSSVGIGTLTYIDPQNGCFGGLGHAICDGSSGVVMPVGSGTITDVNLTGVRKGVSGTPGELTGFLGDRSLGLLHTNSPTGVYGVYNLPYTDSETITAAMKQEVRIGKAKMLTTLPGKSEAEYFDIMIEKINYDDDIPTRNMVIEVTDERLLDITGGIVQGMSGSPIVQEGKMVGAVTHVLVNDPAKGYGIFIENMLEH